MNSDHNQEEPVVQATDKAETEVAAQNEGGAEAPNQAMKTPLNVISVRGNNYHFKTLIDEAKRRLRNESDVVELHALNGEADKVVSAVAECLLSYQYVTLTKLRTKTHQILEPKDMSPVKGFRGTSPVAETESSSSDQE